MTPDLGRLAGDAHALWRRDRALLWPLTAFWVALPQFAILLLVPPMPDVPPDATPQAWEAVLTPWIAAWGGWYVLATLLAQYGALAALSLYLPGGQSVGTAMARAARLFPRALLAGLLVTMPCGVAALLSLSVPLLPLVVLPGIIWVLARAMLIGPVILAERGTGAVAAIGRSWRLTQRRGLPLALLVGAITVGGQAAGALLVAAERAVRAGPLANPLLIAAVDAAAAGVAWAAALALALVQVALYRRLASSGI